jgi:hypothetical protein
MTSAFFWDFALCKIPKEGRSHTFNSIDITRIINPLSAELNLIRHLLALAGDHHFVHVSRIRVKRTPFYLQYYLQI